MKQNEAYKMEDIAKITPNVRRTLTGEDKLLLAILDPSDKKKIAEALKINLRVVQYVCSGTGRVSAATEADVWEEINKILEPAADRLLDIKKTKKQPSFKR